MSRLGVQPPVVLGDVVRVEVGARGDNLRREHARITEAITRLQRSQQALDTMLAIALRQPASVPDEPEDAELA
ncbi:hypothetical protein ABZ260_01875 [Streptosporangium sp. NPDC006013]|uniref:hypothetical protein n=1 Tax=Streptosporangium sp. NPDC006013 TaxID=3155596 RepID=UPI0033B486EB